MTVLLLVAQLALSGCTDRTRASVDLRDAEAAAMTTGSDEGSNRLSEQLQRVIDAYNGEGPAVLLGYAENLDCGMHGGPTVVYLAVAARFARLITDTRRKLQGRGLKECVVVDLTVVELTGVEDAPLRRLADISQATGPLGLLFRYVDDQPESLTEMSGWAPPDAFWWPPPELPPDVGGQAVESGSHNNEMHQTTGRADDPPPGRS